MKIPSLIALLSAVLLPLSVLGDGVYPDDHWTYSTKLTEENFDDFIKVGPFSKGYTVSCCAIGIALFVV